MVGNKLILFKCRANFACNIPGICTMSCAEAFGHVFSGRYRAQTVESSGNGYLWADPMLCYGQ